tara:strand:- start:58 stop:1032 length:975 start_codon:yes stop_codon:yes gene_type:complete
MPFSTKKIGLYDKSTDPKVGVSNAYDNVLQGGIDGNCLCGIFGLRNSGKTYVCSKIINQAQKTNVYDRIYLITPTFLSNKSYFGSHIDEEDVFEPTRDSIKHVISLVEADRDEFEIYLQELEDYKDYMKTLNSKNDFTESQLYKYDELCWLDGLPERPVWKYAKRNKGKVRPPQSLVILDDVLSSPVVSSPYFTKIAVMNRHIAGLNEPYGERSACGLGVIFNSQTYSMQQGVSRVLRQNLTHMIIFKNKQQKQMDKMIDELAGAVDQDKFMEAYAYAIKEKHDSLLISFKPHCPTHTFKRNMNELIIFQDDLKECHCKGDKKD